MRKKLLVSFLIVIIIGISITGVFSLRLIEEFYLKNLEDKLVTNASLISQLFIDEYKGAGSSYDSLAKRFSKISNARVTIIADDGTVIGESQADSNRMENHGDRIEIKDALSGKVGKSSRFSSTEKIDMMYIAVPVNEDNVPKYVMRLAVPLTDIQSIQRSFLKYISIAILAGLLCSFIIAYSFARRITNPINHMTKISSQIANGSYDKRINLRSNDEIGELAHTFNYMAEKLQITIHDLSDKKNNLEAILKSMQSGVIAVDNIGRIILVNPAAVNMFGLKDNVVGKHVLEVIRNAELDNIIYNCQDENKEIKLNYPEKRILRVKATPIMDIEGSNNKLGVVVVMQDVTELKKLEQIRTDFVANVSHELKTPLTSIKGFTETLRNGAIKDPSASEKFLDIINIETDRLTRLINDILNLSELENKRQNIPFEKISINTAIDEVEEMMKNIARLKNIKLTFSKETAVSYVMGNHDKVKQLLINLIDNAIKYTHEGGSVEVNTYHKERSVFIEISDTGIGIPKEHLSRLFERFYRVDKGRSRTLGGTGLGLAIVKHIVATMGGEIKVDSEPGKGSTFTVIIPRV